MTIKENLINPSSTPSLKEFNFLIEKLHQEYDSSLNKNKFIVGGAIEHFLSCLFRSFNLKCIHFGAKSVGFDLIIKDQPFSIKFGSTLSSSFVISNKRGKNMKHEWIYPTIFVIGGYGICYADPLQIANTSKIL